MRASFGTRSAAWVAVVFFGCGGVASVPLVGTDGGNGDATTGSSSGSGSTSGGSSSSGSSGSGSSSSGGSSGGSSSSGSSSSGSSSSGSSSSGSSSGGGSSSGSSSSGSSSSGGSGSSSGGDAGGGACTSDKQCDQGMLCGFLEADMCSAMGTCVPDTGARCNAILLGCACDGTDINVICLGLPDGYASKPLAHMGTCTVGIEGGAECSTDSQCPTGLKCCYPCGRPGCVNVCMKPQPNGMCPMYP